MSESYIHPRPACDSADEMIAKAQPPHITLQDITHWEMECTHYQNIESTHEVGPDPVTCNELATLTMCAPTKEFPELFSEEKPTELLACRYAMEIIQDTIDVLPDSHWSTRFPNTYNHLQDQIMEKCNSELETGRVVPCKSSNAIGMFTYPKRDKPHEARFLLDCIPSNLVTQKDKTQMPSMEQIINVVGSRPFRNKRDVLDGYHNIRIHPESVTDAAFCCQMSKYDSLVM